MAQVFKYDLDIALGSDMYETFAWAIDGVPVDLTGATVEVSFRRSPGAPVLLQLTSANTKAAVLAISDAAIASGKPDGWIMKPKAADLAVLAGSGVYRVELTYADTRVELKQMGAFKTFTE